MPSDWPFMVIVNASRLLNGSINFRNRTVILYNPFDYVFSASVRRYRGSCLRPARHVSATLRACERGYTPKVSTGKNEVCLRGPQITGSNLSLPGYETKITEFRPQRQSIFSILPI